MEDALVLMGPITGHFPVSEEQVRSSKQILKSFAENTSKSQVGKLECGQSKLLVNLFIAENKKMIAKHHMRSVSQVEVTNPLSAFSTISQSIR